MTDAQDKPAGAGFTRVEPAVDIPAMEKEILELWRRTKAFEESVLRRPADN